MQEKADVTIVIFTTIVGGWVWSFATTLTGFPLNDGGMFQVMIRSIVENNMRLPDLIHYNGLDLPFAYPPLSFYIGALVSRIFHVEPVEILRWLPVFIITLSIPAFYYLAKLIVGSSSKAGAAAFIFAFTPRAMDWRIMGGGLSRSFGLLFLLLTLVSVLQLFEKNSRKYLFAAILFAALTVLSHPEAAIHTIGFSLLIWIFKGRNKETAFNAIQVGFGTILLTSPWWIHLLTRFGPDPVLAAAQTGFHSAFAVLIPIFFTLTDEPLVTFIAVLGIIGFVRQIAKRDYLLSIAYILPFLVEPRSAPVYAVIPLAMLAALTLFEVVIPAMPKGRGAPQILVVFIAFHLIGGALYFQTQFSGTSVSPANREAFEWIKTNTPPESRFLVLTGEEDIFCDGISEWFPALTERTSLTTIQGIEWVPGKFTSISSTQRTMQACLADTNALDCIENTAQSSGLTYDYIYIARQSTIKTACRVTASTTRGDNLINTLTTNNRYLSVFQTNEVSIFQFQH
jgi:hypothetical protein